MKTTEELKELAIKAEKPKSYILFPEQKIGEIFKQDYDLLKNAEMGDIDEDGEFFPSSDGEWYRISWWNGSSTSARWSHCDELEFRELMCLGTLTTDRQGPNEFYETYFYDKENNEFYVEFSDTIQQKITQELVLVDDLERNRGL